MGNEEPAGSLIDVGGIAMSTTPSIASQSHLDMISVLRNAQACGRDVFVSQDVAIKALGKFGQLGFNIKKITKENE